MGVGQDIQNFQFQQKTKNVKILTSPIVGISVYSKIGARVPDTTRPWPCLDLSAIPPPPFGDDNGGGGGLV